MASKSKELICRCSFCNRPASEVGGVVTSPTGAHLCEACSHVSSMIFFRRNELMEKAKEISDAAKETDTRFNEEGECNCMPCTLARLVDNDDEINQLVQIGADHADHNGVTKH
jgi:hypothetical protein